MAANMEKFAFVGRQNASIKAIWHYSAPQNRAHFGYDLPTRKLREAAIFAMIYTNTYYLQLTLVQYLFSTS